MNRSLAQIQKPKKGLAPLASLARPCIIAFGRGRMEVTAGRLDEDWARNWKLTTSRLAFEDRFREGLSFVVSSVPFTIYREGARCEYMMSGGSAFISSSDIKEAYIPSGYPIAIKFTVPAEPCPFPLDFPLMANDGPSGEKLVGLARLTIPLRISTYHFSDGPCGRGMPCMAKGGIELGASERPRILCAYGDGISLSGNDLAKGMIGLLPPGQGISLEVERHPRITGNASAPAFGSVFIAEYVGEL